MNKLSLRIAVQLQDVADRDKVSDLLQKNDCGVHFVRTLQAHTCQAQLYVGKSITLTQAKDMSDLVVKLSTPLLVLLEEAEQDIVDCLVNADVAMVYVGAWPEERFSQLLSVAQARYLASCRQKMQLAAGQKKLAEVRVISQAKGLLMQQQNISEARAHSAMQRLAMNRGVSLSEIARQLLG